jgi:hypothetical protein
MRHRLTTPKPAVEKFACVLVRSVVTALWLFVARRRGSAAAELGYVLLFLLGRFQNLQTSC